MQENAEQEGVCVCTFERDRKREVVRREKS